VGQYDSSKTRVAPLFDALLARDATGGSWLDALLALGSRTEIAVTLPRNQRLVPDHGRRWGSDEATLPAPTKLLEYLVQNVDPPLAAASKDRGQTRALRLALARRDAQTVAAALRALRSGDRGRKWFVLEGESRPDAILETSELVVCIEGKRTEAACTTHTSWMRRRSQLVRHMDAALEAFPMKRIVGLLIVEGTGAKADAPSGHWLSQCSEQYEGSMLAESLPHRSAFDRSRIGDGILGVTTWQTVCAALAVKFSDLPNAIRQPGKRHDELIR
jgi:hypothetical protein